MIEKETIIRLIVLVLVLVNQILCSTGVMTSEIEEDKIYELISTLATVGASAWAMWKNNSFTKDAIEADKYLKELKSKKK